MHSFLKHKMLQLTLKISLYMAPTGFGPFGPSSGSIRRNLAEVTVFVEIISKHTPLKLLLCSGNMCFMWCVFWVLCGWVRLYYENTYLPHRREEFFQIPGPNSLRQLHTKYRSCISFLRRQLIYRPPVIQTTTISRQHRYVDHSQSSILSNVESGCLNIVCDPLTRHANVALNITLWNENSSSYTWGRRLKKKEKTFCSTTGVWSKK
jgi:hypothetical protein